MHLIGKTLVVWHSNVSQTNPIEHIKSRSQCCLIFLALSGGFLMRQWQLFIKSAHGTFFLLSFFQERLVQACKCVVLAYADREEHAMGVELSLPGLDHSALVEEVKETTALVILALRSMMHICEEQASNSLFGVTDAI